MVNRLFERLRVGGTLLIIDWTIPEQSQLQSYLDAQPHDHGSQNLASRARHLVSRFGFDTAEMQTIFLNVGCSESSIEYLENEEISTMPEEVIGVKGGVQNRLFFAKGSRA